VPLVGQVYRTERATLIHGDCLDVLRDLPDASVDAVITDPPYGINLRNHGGGSVRTARTWKVVGDNSQDVAMAVAHWANDAKVCSAFFSSPYNPLPGKWRNILVWDKGPAVGAGGDRATCWKRTFELIYVRHNRPLNGKREPAVLQFWVSPNFRKDCRYHPMQKPVPLMCYLIEKLTQPGDTVVDPFMGSGTTGVACIQTGRKFIGIEIDSAYCNIARERIAEAEGAKVCR
jgi:DNA modification methylase